MTITTGGTENHLMLIDVTPFGVSGRQGASALRDCGITCNKNGIPFDKLSPMITSGLRLGTPAMTTLGMGEEEMKEIAAIVKLVISHTQPGVVAQGPNAGKPSKIAYKIDAAFQEEATSRVKALLTQFPLYPELDLDFLKQHFVP